MTQIEPDAIESALDEIGSGWKRRDGGWVIPATGRVPCEIDLVMTGAGLRIEGVLATWDAVGDTEARALAALLARAEADLPGVRFALRQGRAVAAIEARGEREILTAVTRIVSASRLLSCEAAVLLMERDIADRYLKFFATGAETSG